MRWSVFAFLIFNLLAILPAGAYQVPPPDIAVCDELVGEVIQPGDAAAAPGIWWNPLREGTGWDFHYSPNGALELYWYTYDRYSRPVWLTTDMVQPNDSDGTWQSLMYKVTWNYTTRRETREPVGSVAISFLPNDPTRAAIQWWWRNKDIPGNQKIYRSTECLVNYFATASAPEQTLTINPTFNGEWTETGANALDGWAMSLVLGQDGFNHYTELETFAIYDTAGHPVWLQAQSARTVNPAPIAPTTYNVAWFEAIGYSEGVPTNDCSSPLVENGPDACRVPSIAGTSTRRFNSGGTNGHLRLAVNADQLGDEDQAIHWNRPSAAAAPEDPRQVPTGNEDDIVIERVPSDDIAVNISGCRVPTGAATCDITVSWNGAGNSGYTVYAAPVGSSQPKQLLSSSSRATLDFAMHAGDRYQFTLERNGGVVARTYEVRAYPAGEHTGLLANPPIPAAVSPPSAVPASSDRVGATAAKFRVDESGHPNYRVELFAPVGSGGLAPRFALVYDSTGGDGHLGPGWHLEGVSTIQRCRRHTEFGDPVATQSPISLTDADAFCLDGQRLILVSGTHAQNGAVYHPERDIRTRVTLSRALESFTFAVQGPDGITRHFGGLNNEPDSRVAIEWKEFAREDSVGNTVSFAYERPNADSMLRLKQATYVGGKVEFVYNDGTAAGSRLSYTAGTAYRWQGRLDEIRAFASDDSTVLRRYQLGYEDIPLHPSRQRIVSLTECGLGGVCLAPTRFTWGKPGGGYGIPDVTEGDTLFSNLVTYQLGDADGDGRTDVFWTDTSESLHVAFARPNSGGTDAGIQFAGSNYYDIAFSDEDVAEHGWLLYDINADGNDDVIYMCAVSTVCGNVPSGTWVVRYAGWLSFSAPTPLPEFDNNLATDFNESDSSLGNWSFLKAATMGDYNGDGLPDLLMGGLDGDQPTFKARYMGAVRDRNLRNFRLPAEVRADRQTQAAPVYAYSEYVTATLLDSAGNACNIDWHDDDSMYNTRTLDFNGDGLADLLVDGSPGCSTATIDPMPSSDPGAVVAGERSKYWTLFINQGTDSAGQVSFEQFHSWQYSGSGETVGEHAGLQLYDVNSDGLTDVLERAPSTRRWVYKLNMGTIERGGMPLLTGAQCVDPACVEFDTTAHELGFFDVDGDGAVDLLPMHNVQGDCGANSRCSYQPYFWDGGGFQQFPSAASKLPYLAGDDDAYWVRMFADFDGDGTMDALSINPDGGSWFATRYRTTDSQTEMRSTLGAGRVTNITNGLAAETNIYYAPLTLSDVYRRDFIAASKDWGRGSAVFDLISPLRVVRLVESSAPTEGDPNNMAMVVYRYEGMKIQTGGRGSLGFRLISNYDFQTGVRTQTEYAQEFPLTGTPVRTSSFFELDFVPSLEGLYEYDFDSDLHHQLRCGTILNPTCQPDNSNRSRLTYTEDEWHWRSLGGSAVDPQLTQGTATPLFVYRDTNTTESYADYDGIYGIQATTITSFTGYDARGNVLGSIKLVFDQDGQTLQNQTSSFRYQDAVDANRWWLGRMTQSIVTTVRPDADGAPVTRTATFDYDDVTQLLSSETLEAEGQGTRTYYDHDDFGNMVGKVVCDWAVTTEAACEPFLRNPTSAPYHPDNAQQFVRYSATGYDSLGRYANVTSGLFWNGSSAELRATQTVQQRDIGGNPTYVSDANGGIVRNVYGALGRKYWQATNSGARSDETYAYCDIYNVRCPSGAAYRVATTTAGAPASWTYYDVTARAMLAIKQGFTPKNSPGTDNYIGVRHYYDVGGNAVAASEPYVSYGPNSSAVGQASAGSIHYTRTSYDALKRPVSVSHPDGSVTSYEYAGTQTTVTLPANNDGQIQTKTQAVNALGETTESTDALGTKVIHERGNRSVSTTISRTASDGGVSVSLSSQLDALGHIISQDSPDRGHWTYVHNALGEQIMAIGPRGTCVRQWYDGQGRVWRTLSYTNSSCTGTFESDVTSTFDTASHGLGALARVWRMNTGSSSSGVSYAFDSIGRPIEAKTQADREYIERTTYDQFGRPFQHLFELPIQLLNPGYHNTGEQFEYGTHGYLRRVRDAYGATYAGGVNHGQIYREIETQNARGQVVDERYADNPHLGIHRDFEPATGRVSVLRAGDGGSIADLHYAYDAIGNMRSRRDQTTTYDANGQGQSRNVFEQFHFDALQRLTSLTRMAAGESAVNRSFVYDAIGNIDNKADGYGVGRGYTYGGQQAACQTEPGSVPAGPHAATLVGAQAHCYDAAGNEIFAPGLRRLYYNAGGKVVQIDQLASGKVVTFSYGPGGARLSRVEQHCVGSNCTVLRSTTYVGDAEIEFGGGESRATIRRHIGPLILTQHRRMKMDGSWIVELDQQYRFTDVLGSTVALTDAFGAFDQPEAHMSFDVWGERRNPETGAPIDARNYPVVETTDIGFTGQRQEDGVGLIALGARWYDPVMGRFVQADSVIGDPTNSQAYNAYTYVLNNPLAYTDPSGHWGEQEQAYLRTVVAIVIAVYTGWYINYAGLSGASAYGVAALGGAAAGAVSSGNLRGAVTGAIGGALFYGVGAAFQHAEWAYTSQGTITTSGWAAKTVAHGFAGGIMAELEGDKFGHGFVSAGFTQSMSGVVGRVPNAGGRVVAAAVVGGTASRMSGGKFANGAVTAAFVRSLNENFNANSGSIGDDGLEHATNGVERLKFAAENMATTLSANGDLSDAFPELSPYLKLSGNIYDDGNGSWHWNPRTSSIDLPPSVVGGDVRLSTSYAYTMLSHEALHGLVYSYDSSYMWHNFWGMGTAHSWIYNKGYQVGAWMDLPRRPPQLRPDISSRSYWNCHNGGACR